MSSTSNPPAVRIVDYHIITTKTGEQLLKGYSKDKQLYDLVFVSGTLYFNWDGSRYLGIQGDPSDNDRIAEYDLEFTVLDPNGFSSKLGLAPGPPPALSFGDEGPYWAYQGPGIHTAYVVPTLSLSNIFNKDEANNARWYIGYDGKNSTYDIEVSTREVDIPGTYTNTGTTTKTYAIVLKTKVGIQDEDGYLMGMSFSVTAVGMLSDIEVHI